MAENVPSPESTLSWTAAARLLRPQGRRGELLAEPLSDIAGLFTAGQKVSVAATTAMAAVETVIESFWSPTGRNAGRIVLKLAGVDSISAAELLAGRELLIPAADLPPLDEDTWFVRDLIGCQLFDGEDLVGEITAVEYPMSADGHTRLPDVAPLLEVTPGSGSRSHSSPASHDKPAAHETALVPFLKTWLQTVDLDHRRIVMHLPNGLVELNRPDGN